MMRQDGVTRSHPLVNTSFKANYAHLELVAGITGLTKCVLMAMWASSLPAPHLRYLNPHIDSNGYPALFASEFVDQGTPTGYFGVSSFGFGGSNARGDVWAMATAGPRSQLPVGFNLSLSRQGLLGKVKTPGANEA